LVMIYRWVTACLWISAVFALLLLANSIRDYRFVSRLIATEQVRHKMSQQAIALEPQLRQDPLTRGSAVNSLMEAEATCYGSNCAAPTARCLSMRAGQHNVTFSPEPRWSPKESGAMWQPLLKFFLPGVFASDCRRQHPYHGMLPSC
jgi:hypothetical protein